MIIGMMSMSFTVNESEETMVLIGTSFGDMKLKLYSDTPQHRDNFVKLVSDGYYNGTLFHRVIKNFMIQGGDPQSKGAAPGTNLGSGGPGYTVPAEILHKYISKKGALCAARQPDRVNPEFASSGSQFYIVQGNIVDPTALLTIEERRNLGLPADKKWNYTDEQVNTYATVGGYPSLDGAYTIFGEMTEGFDVLAAISLAATNKMSRPNVDIPMEIMIIK